MDRPNPDAFPQRLRDRAPLLGSFIKTPSVHATEIFGDLGFDFLVVDEEHGPFNRDAIDVLMLAARAAGIASIVRVAGPASILPALDMGAAGILVPHVDSAADARSAVAAAKYRGGVRGFSPSARAGRYGALGLIDHVERADAQSIVAVMIEHPSAVAAVEEIAAVDGVDALFIGLGDMAVAMGAPSADTPALRESAADVCRAALRHHKAMMATAGSIEAAAWLLDLGVTAIVVGSDQGLMRVEAARQLAAFRARGFQE